MTTDTPQPQDEVAVDGQNTGETDTATRLAALEAELEAARNDVLYARADTQNVRRRLEKVRDAVAASIKTAA